MNYYYKIFTSILKINRLFYKILKRELLDIRITDLNLPEFVMMYCLEDKELTVGQLQDYTDNVSANISYSIKKLVRNDYVIETRSSYDGRERFVKLSDKGLNLLNTLREYMNKNNDKILKYTDKENYLAELTQYLENFENFLLQR